ncbi:MAG: hypothetical protein LBI60_00670 [Bacteroidales bacterium]|nr:hypothetical protein [Bacteroidales bacterium]
MNSIPVKRYITHNCVENCIANLCDSYGIDFRPLFLFSWDIDLKTTDPIFENNIHYHSEFDISIDDFFDTYYDISKLYFNMSFILIINKISDIMSLLIDGNIILIKSNAYYIPWNLAYQRYHVLHSFLITYDSIKKSINVVDSFSSNNTIELENLENLNIEKSLLVKISRDSQNECTPTLLKSRYLPILKSNIKNKVYNSIANFSNELEKISSIAQLTANPDDLSNAILIRRLSNIANARYNTRCLFEYLQWPNNFVEAMNDIYTKWESVKNMFIKIILSKRLKLIPQIRQELITLSNLENDLCHAIIKDNTILGDQL